MQLKAFDLQPEILDEIKGRRSEATKTSHQTERYHGLMTEGLIFGYPDEWRDFEQRNRSFLECLPKLKEALDIAFVRNANVSTAADRAILFLGRLCIEDFMELLCLAANGYGVGAMKLLRGLYERAVTASYLAMYPDEAQNFLDFRFISKYKALQAYVGGGTRDEGWIKKAKEARAKYDEVKARFEVNDCKKCESKRINHFWSKSDFVSMAKRTGELGKLLAQAYYEPLNHAHSTAEAIMMRLEKSESGFIGFKPSPQRSDADRALQIGHAVMVALLEIQVRHFKMGDLAAKVEVSCADHVRVWSERQLAVDPNES